jgi:hypothetical protein
MPLIPATQEAETEGPQVWGYPAKFARSYLRNKIQRGRGHVARGRAHVARGFRFNPQQKNFKKTEKERIKDVSQDGTINYVRILECVNLQLGPNYSPFAISLQYVPIMGRYTSTPFILNLIMWLPGMLADVI